MLSIDAVYVGGVAVSALTLLLSTYFLQQNGVQLTRDSLNLDDVIQPNDEFPVNEVDFWRKIRLRKLFIAASLLGVIACEKSAILWLLPTYLLLLVFVPVHSASITHLSVLSLGISLTKSAILLAPSTKTSASMSIAAFLYSMCAIIALTTPMGPPLCYPGLDGATESVSEYANGSIVNVWLFIFATKVLSLANLPNFQVEHLPIVEARMRAVRNHHDVRRSFNATSRLRLIFHLLRINISTVFKVLLLSFVISFAYYGPPFFLKRLLEYLETDPHRANASSALLWVTGFFLAHFGLSLLMGQMVFMNRVLKTRLELQLHSLLFAKALVRKDVTSAPAPEDHSVNHSKAAIIALMSSDVGQLSALAESIYDIADTPFELLVGVFFLYKLLGVSCLVGLAVTLVCLPLHQRSGSIVADAQSRLFKARDERVSRTNELLGAIKMLKFMALENNFESRLLHIREKELRYQKISFNIETLWTAMGNSVPIIFAIVSFWHFTVIAGHSLTPAIAFTALSIFTEIQFSIKGIPASAIRLIQGFVSAGRISRYLNDAEILPVLPLSSQTRRVVFENACITWPQVAEAGRTPSTPQPFTMKNISLEFPTGELSLVCGRFGSGKTLLLLALLGEAELLSGQVYCPRSPANILASSRAIEEEWIVDGLCAYVPQTAWLRNQSIKDNILFNLPYDEQRYKQTIFACALGEDLRILEDGDDTEIGERGLNLSGGQKQRVDSHTAQHIYKECLKGPLLRGRTVIIVSHYVQLCAPGAAFIVALDQGKVQHQGNLSQFRASPNYGFLVQTDHNMLSAENAEGEKLSAVIDPKQPQAQQGVELAKNTPRKLVQEEQRAIGNVDAAIGLAYFKAWGSRVQWGISLGVLIIAAFSPLLENGWLKIWAGSSTTMPSHSAAFYVTVYAALTFTGLVVKTLRWYILYSGSIHASRRLFQGLLHSILLANVRFHETISRGRLLNRFGKDMEGIDKRISATIGHCVIAFTSAWITFTIISVVGGPVFCLVAVVLGLVFFHYGKMFSIASREMRRLSSVSSSPLHALYWEAVSGITTIRAFGGSTQFMSDMLRLLDINTAPAYWSLATSQWLSFRANALTSVLATAVVVMAVLSPRIDAALAGFTVMFAQNMTNDFQNMAHRFAGLEQDMVALERVKEFSEIEPEEFDDAAKAKPPPEWPQAGEIRAEKLVVRYADDLPPVLHGVSFTISAGEKIGVIGRTGSGKSTLALALFRFVPFTGQIVMDAVDITSIGLRDLRRQLTIIPQDPTILSGTIRSTLDPEGEYSDAAIFDALRRVHLPFDDLETAVSEGGENFSAGEKQLLCLGRAILKQARILIMDEATASVDFSTDKLITQTVRDAFRRSTVLIIAHRLTTIVAYDRVMVLHEGRIAEFDSPRSLLSDPESAFHSMCHAMGDEELQVLKRLAGLESQS
ncbi:Multidrug resistance-associated ABC transporter protein [Mycena indigotica]|uniref:Multidrug resistance-associated ABC transporter protein n=1 Tax=Mycena indigotica TaxID=2126181 RepID=A0A8H6WF67_9AGAR|nr:Multidrug resistance-associated ABC transporter protein [Mycena indigotica]KAF7316454.1 Multidrug resistance-associated ABC transporter protein [Mycena indigotica]